MRERENVDDICTIRSENEGSVKRVAGNDGREDRSLHMQLWRIIHFPKDLKEKSFSC